MKRRNHQSNSICRPGTQAAFIKNLGFDPMTLGGKTVNGEIFKPDADPENRGICEICGDSGIWIAGAGQYLCAKHQDCY